MKTHHVVIIGGGFGGLYAAQAFKNNDRVRVTLIDRRNVHLFQPLLYQVATGGLSPGDIASPLRSVLKKQKNATVLMGEVVGIDAQRKQISLRDDTISYDSLIVATGARHSYFGNDQWAEKAPGLKTIEDATELRRRIFLAFEAAERETDPERRRAWMNFVVVGAGPTGVELSGALGELAHHTLKGEFRSLDTSDVNVLLLEGADRVLPPYPEDLSKEARLSLEELGVTVKTNTFVTDVQDDFVLAKTGDGSTTIPTKTVLWAAGVKASSLGGILAESTGAPLDRVGKVVVNDHLSIDGYDDVYVIGDLAHKVQDDKPLPGVAQVAMQQGSYVAKRIAGQLRGQVSKPFRYFDRGNMAVIGRNAAVADVMGIHIHGFFAWFMWLFIHVIYLVEFDNRILVTMQWAWSYMTKNRGARLITHQKTLELKEKIWRHEREAA